MMQQQQCDDLDSVCVSAPGKVLITGGYLVLDPKHAGLVLASSARFYAHITANGSNAFEVGACIPSRLSRCHARSAAPRRSRFCLCARQSASNSSSGQSEDLHVIVESLQFHQTIRGTLRRNGPTGPYQFLIAYAITCNASASLCRQVTDKTTHAVLLL